MATLKGVLKAGKKFAGEAAGKAKSNAVKGLGNAVFGSGMVGGALNKAFQGKFGEKEGSDTRVADALEAQTKVQDQNSAVLTRIESIVMNIADNVYNLAGVMNAQVVSMQEAQKIQQDRAYKQAADQEEAAAEAKKVQGPSAAGTEVNSVEDKKGGIMGMISGLAGSIGSTKKLFKGFLKKFGVLALGITAAVGAAAYSSSLGDGEKKNEDPSGTISVKGDAEQQSSPFASRTATSTDRWNYYTRTDTYNPVPIPVSYKKRDCMDDVGCNEILSGEEIKVEVMNKPGRTSMYRYDGPKYIPGLI